ncbi:hypothetical protein ACTFIY_008981 [Dictyostelium cf. discoideum]
MAILPLNCQYEKQGYTLPPTTIYYLHMREEFGKITRNDIKNNSTAIDLFGSTNVLPGKLSSVANNETVNINYFRSWLFEISFGFLSNPNLFYIQRNINSVSSFGEIINGWKYEFPAGETNVGMQYEILDASITFDDCSMDYFNITGWNIFQGRIHFILASSLTESYFELKNSTVQYNFRGRYKPFFDKPSNTYYLSEYNDELKHSNLIAFDVKKRTPSIFSFEYKENRSPIAVYKSFYYMGENLNNKYSIYKYDFSHQLSSNNNNNSNNNEEIINKYEIFLELDYEISSVIQSENPSYFILYSDKSNVLIVYNIDTLSYEKYTNFKIPLHHNEKYAQSFIARGGSPIEPNQVKKKNILIPIFISIIGFSVFVFIIIITVLLIKRRNTKKSDEFKKQKDNESEISKK